ncbi:MAG: phytoene desaturase family protein, partial [Flavobacteriales bacterium]
DTLLKLAVDSGVEIVLNTQAVQIEHENRVVRSVISNSGRHKADVVVCNSDIHQAYKQLLPDEHLSPKQKNQEASSSALIFYWGINKSFPELHLHNMFFAENYEEEFECLFTSKQLHSDPSIYVNITSKINKKDAPEGKENWFVMINAPSSKEGLSRENIAKAKEHILKKLSSHLSCNISDHIEEEELLSPQLIQSKTGSHMGALYGSSSNNRNSAFLRHPNFHSKIKGLYFAGGSVHPGGGIPLCLLSAKIINDLVD